MPFRDEAGLSTEPARSPPSTEPAYDLGTPLLRLVEDSVGADLCVFAAGRVVLGTTCRECAAGPDGQPETHRACQLVRTLAAGERVPPGQVPPVCEAGHAVRLNALDSAGANVLLVKPRGEGRPADLERRLPAIAALWERCERLAGETEGLAQEVIRSYEQLNVIFDITQQICNSSDAAQIKHFLIRRLAQMLNCEWSCCLSPNEGLLWWCGDRKVEGAETVAEVQARHAQLLWQATEQRAPVVFNCNQDSTGEARHSLLFGTIGAPSDTPDILMFARAVASPEFIYGDVMMIDSVLNHAQNVLANLKLVERLRSMSLGAVRALVSAIDKKDHYTSGHSERVGFLSHLIGQKMGLSPEQLQDLEWGGLLHDVGKIGIQDGILAKPGGLTPEEFDQIKQHVVMSYEIVAPIECMAGVRDIVLYHHEVPDGTGYPKGLKADETPLLARIVHVADTFDALTTSRSYRTAFSRDKTLSIMEKEKGTKLDTAIVDAFVEAFAEFRAQQPDRFRQLFSHLVEEQS